MQLLKLILLVDLECRKKTSIEFYSLYFREVYQKTLMLIFSLTLIKIIFKLHLPLNSSIPLCIFLPFFQD